jgi:hypothetical protein
MTIMSPPIPTTSNMIVALAMGLVVEEAVLPIRVGPMSISTAVEVDVLDMAGHAVAAEEDTTVDLASMNADIMVI